MSELTRCNYCSFKILKDRNKKETVKLVNSKRMKGWKAAEVNKKEVAWFKEVGNHCEC